MPTTLDGLCSVGLPDIPIWWRAAMAAGMQTGGLMARKSGKKKQRPKRLHMEGLRMAVLEDGGPVVLGGREEGGEDADDEGEGPAARVTEENLIDV